MRITWVVTLLTVACVAEEAGDNGIALIDATPSCENCRIEFREIATLGDADAPVSISEDLETCTIGRLSTGEFVSSAPVGGGELLLFDAGGRVVQRIGRRGQGPGELLGDTRVIVGPGDTLHLLNNTNARIQVLTRDGEYVRSFRLPTRMSSWALLTDGSYVLHPGWTSITEPGQPLYAVYSSGGDLLASVGAWDGRRSGDWVVSSALSGGFWEGKEDRPDVHHWSADGRLGRSVSLKADWFRFDPQPSPEHPFPPASLLHVWEDAPDRLWLYFLATSQGAPPWPAGEQGVDAITLSLFEETFFTRVAVIDVKRLRLLAIDSTDDLLLPTCGGSLMYSVLQLEDGDTRVRVFEPILEGSDSGEGSGG